MNKTTNKQPVTPRSVKAPGSKPMEISGLGKVIFGITLEDLYCGMAMQGMLANEHHFSKIDDPELVLRATKVGKMLYEHREHSRLINK